jgi:hypothetical protein
MSLYGIPGVEVREILGYACPYLVDLTIDGRPAYFRYRHGALRLAFEDGAEECVSMACASDTLSSEEVETLVVNRLLPELRAETTGNTIDAQVASALVKDFLSYAKDRRSYKMYDTQDYEPIEADATLLDWAINEWAAQRGRSSHNE